MKHNNYNQHKKTSKSPDKKTNIKHAKVVHNEFEINLNKVSPSLTEKTKMKKSNEQFIVSNDGILPVKKSKIDPKADEFSMNKNDDICDISFANTVEMLLEQESSDSDDMFEFSGNSSVFFKETASTSLDTNNKLCHLSEPEEVVDKGVETLNINKGALTIVKDTLYIHGATRLTVVKGCVEILGYRISENEVHDVYSLRGTSLLSINKIPHESHLNITEISKKLNIDKTTLSNFLMNIEDDALIFCETLDNKLIKVLDKYVPQQLIPSTDLRFKFIQDSNDMNLINITQSWHDLINYIKDNSRILIAGGKGVGKSTLLRYLVNKLLIKYSKVLVVDLDPGQAEFTIPGCVSCTVITKPLLGPNYTHLQKPERCFYVPNISVLHSPMEYVESVKKLFESYEDFEEFPTIINSMGYARNLASELLSSVICISNPSLIFQINSQNVKKNYNVNLDLNIIEKSAEFFTPGLKIKRKFQICKVDAPSDNCTSWTCGPRQLREMCIISYLSRLIKNSALLTDGSIPTYMISLSSINIITSKESVYPLAVANANLVSLCSIADTKESTKIFDCFGWGIVRAIDTKKNVIYLMTPLNQNEIDRVKCLIVGSVKLPSYIYTTVGDVNGTNPYLSFGFESIFSQIPKRAYIPKK